MAKSRCSGDQAGFSTIEVLLATTILAGALAGLAQMFAVATRSNQSAKWGTFTTLLAQQKMEQLRSLTWGFDALGLPLTDSMSSLTVDPATPTGGTGLTPSPAGTLNDNTAGYVDYLDQYGRWIGTGNLPPLETKYIRRWSIEALPTNPNNTLILQVLVTRARTRGNAELGSVARLPDEARLISVKTRKAS